MPPMTPDEAHEASRAIVIWTGRGYTSPLRPERSWKRLSEELGEEATARLRPVVSRLHDEFYQSDAYLTRNPKKAYHQVVGRFRELHPELCDEALESLWWCYSWDYDLDD